MEHELAEADAAPRGDVEQRGGAARRPDPGGIGIGVRVRLARDHQAHLRLARLDHRRDDMQGVEHAAGAVEQVERERAPALELDVDAQPVLHVRGDRRLAGVPVAVHAGVHQHAHVGRVVARGREAPLAGDDGVLDGAPAEQAVARRARPEALDAAAAHQATSCFFVVEAEADCAAR